MCDCILSLGLREGCFVHFVCLCVDAPGYGVLRKPQTVCRAERLFIYRDTLSLEALEDDCLHAKDTGRRGQ